ncbi:MAG TPA: molybdopterin oxidoreductase family protein [Burkholderiaceae bacterium]|jgi:anaerobic selenocysteine-containing dehydrogenase|nr:molybdopterin oxidoreductase family protein [Burkholderiaceae bacterium]
MVVRAACPHDCPDTCAMLVTVRPDPAGRRVAVAISGDPEHPTTDGKLCTKVARYLERTYHPERVLTPLRRVGPKGAGRFEATTWEQALEDIARRLGPIAARAPEAIVPYSYAGTMGLVQGEAMAQRWFNRLGASRLDRTICSQAGSEALTYTLGSRLGTDIEQAEQSRLIIFWGANAVTSNLHFWSRAQQAKRNGARLIAIDPYRSLTAEKCHQHIALLPGTDGALALGLMHVLVREGWLDRDYLERYTLGFEALAERAQQFTPERVASICSISVSEIEQLAHDFWHTRPALIRLNYGMQRTRGGGNAVRAIACLPALAGHWRDVGGGFLLSSSGAFEVDDAALTRPDLLAGRTPRTINMSAIGEALANADPPIEALVVYNSNPVAVAPQSGSVVRGFAREDLFTVVLEHFLTDTADYADYVLPATTQLEHLDVHRSYGHLYVVANNPAIEPLGQALPNSEIFRRLAARMGFTEPCFRESDEQIAAQAFTRRKTTAGYDWNQVRERGWWRLNVPASYAPFAAGNFPTPSGRCEFYSDRLAAQGLDPLPDYVAPYENPTSSPELAQRFPLAIISPPARNYLNSTFVNVRSLRDAEGEPRLEIHPHDAAERAIADGDRVTVFNDRGSLELKARVTDRARPGVVVALSVWWRKLTSDGRNANELTHQRLTDLGRGATFYDCLVQVRLSSQRPSSPADPLPAGHGRPSRSSPASDAG